MVDKKDSSSGGRTFSEGDQKKKKRPTATLDLEAVEVKSEEEENQPAGENSQKTDEPSRGETEFSMPGVNSNIAAGIIGGVVVAALFWAIIQFAGSSSTPNADVVAQLTARINKLDAAAKKDLQAEAQKAFEKYESKLTQIDKRIAAIADSAKSEDGKVAQAAAITNLLTDMENNFVKKIGELQNRLEVQMSDRIRESAIQLRRSFPIGAAMSGPASSDFVRKMVNENTVELNNNMAELSREFAKVKDINVRFQEQIKTYEATVGRQNERIRELVSEIAVLREKAADQSNVQAAVGPVLDRVAAIEQNIKKNAKDTKQQEISAKNTALSLAYTGLKRAADRGDQYGAELESFIEIAEESEHFRTLQRYQTKGVPTLRSLELAFKPLLPRIIQADIEPKTSSLWDRFAANATSYFKFRRTGNIPGGSAEAIVARMEHHLKKRNFEKALSEGKGLKGAAKKEAAPWLDKLEARLTLDETLQKIEMRLLSRLGAGQGGERREVH